MLQLEEAEETLTKHPEEANHHIVRARDLARQSLKEARRSLAHMRPATSQNDLPGAIRRLLSDLRQETDAAVELSTEGKPVRYLPKSRTTFCGSRRRLCITQSVTGKRIEFR